MLNNEFIFKSNSFLGTVIKIKSSYRKLVCSSNRLILKGVSTVLIDLYLIIMLQQQNNIEYIIVY